MDKYQPLTEYAPTWKRVDKHTPPKNVKLLFRSRFGALVVGVWYDEAGWDFWCPMPKHSEEDKAWIKAQSSASGRFADGKPYGQED